MWCRVFYFNDKNILTSLSRRRREESTSSRARETCVSAAILVTNHFFRARLDLLLDHVGSLLDGGDLFRAFFVERDLEFLLERHHDFDGVERVGAQVDKLGARGDGVEVGAELFGDDGSDLVEGVIALRARYTQIKSQYRRKASSNRRPVPSRPPSPSRRVSLVESSLSRRVASSRHAPPPR